MRGSPGSSAEAAWPRGPGGQASPVPPAASRRGGMGAASPPSRLLGTAAGAGWWHQRGAAQGRTTCRSPQAHPSFLDPRRSFSTPRRII